MFELFRTPRIDFMRLRGFAYILSGTILILSVGLLAWHKAKTGDMMEYGIDFKGGTLMQVRFAEQPDVSRLREHLKSAGFANASIQRYGKAEENSILIRVSEQLEETHDLGSRIRAALRPEAELAKEKQGLVDLNTVGEAELAAAIEKQATGGNEKSPDPVYMKASRGVVGLRGSQPGGMFHDVADVKPAHDLSPEMYEGLAKYVYVGSLAFQRTESVGPAVGKDLRLKALVASILANGLILIYLWFRFELRFGVAAVVCLVHDVIFITGVFAFTGREFDLTVLAAILTVIGYSVNDTIVVFDRVRTNLKVMKKSPLEEIINASVNQTLSRTVLTSGLTLCVVVSLYLFGGEVLNGFAFALLIGIVEGTYSSIFVASPLLLIWRRIFGTS